MNFLVYIYLFLYFSYVILGPHYINRFFRGDQLKIASNLIQIFRRMLFLSYIALLYSAYYFYNPNIETFINTLIINLISLIAFIIKWYNTKNQHKYYYSGIWMHFSLIFPLLLSLFFIQIKFNYKFGNLSLFTLVFLIIYLFIEKNIYNSGLNFRDKIINTNKY